MSSGQGRTAYRTSKEPADNPGDLFPFTLQREMAGVEQVDFGVPIIALKGFGARRQEERIVLAPDSQQRWPLRT
jgi:hypothetical protein